MADYRDEDEQIATLRNWWTENGTSLIVGLVVALVAIFGWRTWQQRSQQAQVDASTQFQILQNTTQNLRNQSAAVASPAGAPGSDDTDESEVTSLRDDATLQAEQLIEQHPERFYSLLAALTRARIAMDAGEYDKALSTLEEARTRTEDAALHAIIDVRRARVHAVAGRIDEGVALLATPPSEDFEWYFAELRGDLLKHKGQLDEARRAYAEALTAASKVGTEASMIQMKVDDLAER